MVDKKMEDNIAQFCGVTGASVKDAKKFLEKYKRVDLAIDMYYNDPNALAATAKQKQSEPSTSKLTSLFDKYKDPDGEDITIDGTIKLCEDLGVDPEDVVLLAIAYELKSPRMGQWTKAGWIEGLKGLGCENIPQLKAQLPKLRDKLSNDSAYFRKVYSHTFDFTRQEGQRSLALDTAQSFWALLIPHGLKGSALSHTSSENDGEDVTMGDANEEGWQPGYLDLWLQFLGEKGGKGVSKDTWNMFLDFVRTIDAKFTKYDPEAAWPSIIDDFVGWMKERV